MPTVAYLTLSTYAGLVAGASHHMARLRGPDREEIDVVYTITKRDAKKLNQQNKESDDPYRYKVGSTCNRFFDREDALAEALKVANAKWPTDLILYQGNAAVCDPQPMLIGPEPLKSLVNGMVAEAEAIDWYEQDEKAMDAIFKRYQALLKEHGLD